MISNTAKQFIEKEREYFAPMNARETRSTAEERTAWRGETIRQRQERISLEVYEMVQGRVAYGPFEGMRLNRERWWGALDLGSQCLGLYEKEVLEQLTLIQDERKYDFFIDIGAADGYYTTGVLCSGLFNKAIAFEALPKGQDAILASWLENNSPGELEILGEATEHALVNLPNEALDSALVLVDVEGAEFDILSPIVLEKLLHSTIVIEIHNWINDFEHRYFAFLESAFNLFKVEVLSPVSRDIHKYQELRDFTDDNRLLLVSERRPCQMRFLKLSPKP